MLCRTLIEAGFISFYFKIYIFDLVMPKVRWNQGGEYNYFQIYYCNATPCLSKTACFVSRPNEKTYVLHIMFILACFTLSCSIFELLNLGLSAPIKAWKNRHKDITNVIKNYINFLNKYFRIHDMLQKNTLLFQLLLPN